MTPFTCQALLALTLLTAQGDPTAEERARALAPRVAGYAARVELIRLGPPAVPILLEQVTRAAPRIADESVGTLRWIVRHWRHDPAARDELVELLGDHAVGPSPADRRVFAVDLLGDLGGGGAVERLEPLLDDEALWPTAALALERIPGGTAREALVRAAGTGSGARRDAVYAALGRRAETASVPFLLTESERSDGALAALAAFEEPEVIETLVAAALDAGDPARRSVALRTLLSNDAALADGALLARVAAGGDDDARRRIYGAIRSPRQFHPDLAELLDAPSDDGDLETARLRALTALGPERAAGTASRCVDEIRAGQREPPLRARALRLCATRCDGSAATLVAPSLAAADGEERHAAAAALARMEGAGAVEALLRALETAPDEPTAEMLIDALGSRRDGLAVEAVLELLDRSSGARLAAVRAAARELAAAVEPDAANRLWSALLRGAPDETAVDGLAATGGPEHVDDLVAVLAAGDGATRAGAREALTRLGSRLAADGATAAATVALRAAFEAGAPVAADLRRLGQRVELVAHGGRIDAWWQARSPLAGGCPGSPANGREAADGRPAIAGTPSGEVPAELAGALADSPVPLRAWRPRQAADPRGLVRLPAGRAGTTEWLGADLTPREPAENEVAHEPQLPAAG